MPVYKIPRQSDREIVAALGRVRLAVKPLIALELRLALPPRGGKEITLPEQNPEDSGGIAFVLDAGSEVVELIKLWSSPNNQSAVTFSRTFEKVFDLVTVEENWANQLQENLRTQCWLALVAAVRKELKAIEMDAAFRGQDDDAFSRYRDAQTAIFGSLQQALQTLLVTSANDKAELDRERDERFAKLEEKLRSDLAGEKVALEKQLSDQLTNLGLREKALIDREAAFETKESQYVARQKQSEQITQIEEWLEDWQLTEPTSKKRNPIKWAYVCALIFTGLVTIYCVYRSYDLLQTTDDLAKIQLWQWCALTLKTLFPLAAFTTFLIYFIRWSGDWARQHADEEFRNRTLLIDIGRSSWLLEAVRDAQERNKEIPPELIKELSRNLFTNAKAGNKDVHPQAVADVILQGLSSIRVKSPDGAEVEAKRGK